MGLSSGPIQKSYSNKVKEWAGCLSFMKPHFKEHETQSNVPAVHQIELQSDESCVVELDSPTCSSANADVGTPNRRNSSKQQQDSASALLKEYLLQKNSDTDSGGIKNIFLSMTKTVSQFSPMRQIEAKNKVFNIISELEIQQLRENQSDHCYTTLS